jgi:hypothetical protein
LQDAAASGRGIHQFAARTFGTPDHDLTRTVYHECSHAAVARALGYDAEVLIFNQQNGFCRTRVDHENVVLVALAGSIGATLATYGLATAPAEIEGYLHEMSAADRALAGRYTSEHVAAAGDIVWSRWPAIAGEARSVLRETEAAWQLTPPASSGSSWTRAKALHWYRQQRAPSARAPHTRNGQVAMTPPEWYRRGERLVLAMFARGRSAGQ